jgi:hypothetical protein
MTDSKKKIMPYSKKITMSDNKPPRTTSESVMLTSTIIGNNVSRTNVSQIIVLQTNVSQTIVSRTNASQTIVSQTIVSQTIVTRTNVLLLPPETTSPPSQPTQLRTGVS